MAMDLEKTATPDDATRLASTLRLVSVGKIVLAAMTLVLAFTGYNTARAVNIGLLIVGVNLLALGNLCHSVGTAFGKAGGSQPPPVLTEAIARANRLFGYYLGLIVLAMLVVGYELLMFLIKIASR